MSTSSLQYSLHLHLLVGYANEVGEAFRHVISHSQVMMTYGVASGYVVCDALDKGYKTWQVRFLHLQIAP